MTHDQNKHRQSAKQHESEDYFVQRIIKRILRCFANDRRRQTAIQTTPQTLTKRHEGGAGKHKTERDLGFEHFRHTHERVAVRGQRCSGQIPAHTHAQSNTTTERTHVPCLHDDHNLLDRRARKRLPESSECTGREEVSVPQLPSVN